MSMYCEHCRKEIGCDGGPVVCATIDGSRSNEVGQIIKTTKEPHFFCSFACNHKFIKHKNIKSVVGTIKNYQELIKEIQKECVMIGIVKNVVEFLKLSILVLRNKITLETYKKQIEDFLEQSFETDDAKWYCNITQLLQNTINLATKA